MLNGNVWRWCCKSWDVPWDAGRILETLSSTVVRLREGGHHWRRLELLEKVGRGWGNFGGVAETLEMLVDLPQARL